MKLNKLKLNSDKIEVLWIEGKTGLGIDMHTAVDTSYTLIKRVSSTSGDLLDHSLTLDKRKKVAVLTV